MRDINPIRLIEGDGYATEGYGNFLDLNPVSI